MKDKPHSSTATAEPVKTTLLKLFNTIYSPSSGKILYKGQNLKEINTIELRREVLLIGQQVFLFDDKTIEENFAELYAYRSLPPPNKKKMLEHLKLCIADFPLNSPCFSMSGGERQRIFNALLHRIFTSFEPVTLILDEPTSSLDTENAKHFLKNITSLDRKPTIIIIIVNHDQYLVKTFANQIIRL